MWVMKCRDFLCETLKFKEKIRIEHGDPEWKISHRHSILQCQKLKQEIIKKLTS